MTILDKIVSTKKAALAKQKKAVPLKKFLGFLDEPLAAPRFESVLRRKGVHLIAEVKKASPSAGVIRKDFDYLEIARAYEAAGASCLSVLTENRYFQGRLSYFDDIRDAVRVPMLRKDFIIDTYQIYESKLHRADAILLIASLLDEKKLKSFLELCVEVKLDALVEVHDEKECEKALGAGASFIGINTRNLKDFTVDLDILPRLLAGIPKSCAVVAESGVKTLADLALLKSLKLNAVLVGEALMRAQNPGTEARAFVDFLKK